VNRRGTMNKLKMLVLTALAAATVGTGALAAAPSASAMPLSESYCKSLVAKQQDAIFEANWNYTHGNILMGAYYMDLAYKIQALYDSGC
jgi:hypothetical protein